MTVNKIKVTDTGRFRELWGGFLDRASDQNIRGVLTENNYKHILTYINAIVLTQDAHWSSPGFS